MFRELPNPLRFIGWFLFVSYAIGGPGMVVVELSGGVVSNRFGLVPEFIYLVGTIQFACALLLFSPKLASWSLAVLSVLSLGAVGLHLMIASPLTGIPALGYTALQAWFAIRLHRN